MDPLPTKKPGQRYVRKELKQRGWSPDMIDRHLTKRGDQKTGLYFLASEVAEKEKVPEIAEALVKGRARRTELAGYRSFSKKTLFDYAKKARELLEAAFQAAQIPAGLQTICTLISDYLLSAVEELPNYKGARAVTREEMEAEYLALGEATIPQAQHDASHFWMLGYQPSKLIDEYPSLICALAEREICELRAHGVKEEVDELFSVRAVRACFPKEPLYYCYLAYYVPKSISRQLSKLLAVDPKDEYPSARCMARKAIVHVGGTNTGKTYQGLQRLKAAETGVYLAPLRLLALEVQETLLDEGVICSMLTGEEEDIRPGATHISSTVEKLDVDRSYDVAVIDECQMICDPRRGFAWTRAILGVKTKEIHLCTAPEGLAILERILKDLGDPYEIVQHERKVPLLWQPKPASLDRPKRGDAFVAFSKREVLQMAGYLRERGRSVSIVYGALPYVTRRQQMQRFLEGETEILVATDAIGMGLNLPIRRIVFTDSQKFDGIERRPLYPSEVRQIAGRAGRFGKYDQGFVATTGFPSDLHARLETDPEPVTEAYLGFSDLVLRVDRPLSDILRVWAQMPVPAPYTRMDISRYIYIIRVIEIQLGLELSKEDLLRASCIPFDERNEWLLERFGSYLRAYARGCEQVLRPILPGRTLSLLEAYYKELDLYYSFSRMFGLRYDKEWLAAEKQGIAEEIDRMLVDGPKEKRRNW